MISVAILACALNVPASTMDMVVRVESNYNQYAIHVNNLDAPQPVATDKADAVAKVKHYIELGYNVDIGYAQINSRNLIKFNYSIEDAFDPCNNVGAGGVILSDFYQVAVATFGPGQIALATALSAYNTGNFWNGFKNGYVAQYFAVPKVAQQPQPGAKLAAVVPEQVKLAARRNADGLVYQ